MKHSHNDGLAMAPPRGQPGTVEWRWHDDHKKPTSETRPNQNIDGRQGARPLANQLPGAVESNGRGLIDMLLMLLPSA